MVLALHAGAKASTRCAWDGIDLPLEQGNWPLIAASPLQYLQGISQTARAMTRADMDEVLAQFVAATEAAAETGADWLELHCAHGYLLSGFISPLTNWRSDDYGGTLANRLR
ncbi:bifunctional salicylyl-CoA 5-hydroxylase/oxidoreductase, partial [Verminephrobacter sp. Larva24]